MSFFKKLDGLMGDYTVTLTITKEKDRMIVMFMPRIIVKEGDKPVDIMPLTASGSADDLDAGFLDLINASMPAVKGLQSSLKEFQESLESEKKKVTDKAKKTSKNEKKEDPKKEKEPDIFDSTNIDEETGEVLDDLDDDIPFKPDPPKAAPVVAKPKTAAPKKVEPKLEMEEPVKEEPVKETPKAVEDEW